MAMTRRRITRAPALCCLLLAAAADALRAPRAPLRTTIRAARRPARRPPAMMSELERSNKSKLQTIVKDKVEEETKVQEDQSLEEPWRLLLHNDDVHTFEYVTYMIQKIIPTVSNAKAYQLTMTTHCEGVSTVTQTAKPLAQKYCVQLQKGGLTASISPDSNFRDNREGGGDDGPATQ
mmetsp:Transcript_23674/g.71000  ORF Transcript_23674/g.71000 Transcript_23674/m.71000 type:complete len:178 (+) Transcript_23674:144-677(+)